MRALQTVIAAIAELFAPDPTMTRVRARATLETVMALVATLLAVALAVGYQVLGRWARHTDARD